LFGQAGKSLQRVDRLFVIEGMLDTLGAQRFAGRLRIFLFDPFEDGQTDQNNEIPTEYGQDHTGQG
jgi:hypothetical protein